MKLLIIILLSIIINTEEIYLNIEPRFKIFATISDFDKTKHEITYCKPTEDIGGNWVGACLIDGKPFYGTDWGVPTSKIDYIKLVIKNDTFSLNTSLMYDVSKNQLQNLIFENIEGGYSIYGRFSDGAGSYEVGWEIINSVPIRVMLRDSEY